MPEELTLTVTGMTCGGCENAVKRVVSSLAGVTRVTASHRDNTVTLEYDSARTSRTAVAAAIRTAGYGVGPESGDRVNE